MQGEILAMQMMKAAINGTMSDRRLLLQFIEAHEVREAKREELRLKKAANGTEEIDWDVEREDTYQRLLKATAASRVNKGTKRTVARSRKRSSCVQLFATTFSSRLDRERIILSDHGTASKSQKHRPSPIRA